MTKSKVVRDGALAVLMIAGAALVPASVQAQATSAPREIDVAAGPLGAAITALGQKTGTMIVFDPTLVRGRRADRLQGTYTPNQALTRLLRGSGIKARSDGRGGFELIRVARAQRADQRMEGQTTPAISTTQVGPADTEIVVYGARETTTLAQAASSVGIVTAKNLEEGQIRTTQEVFRRLGNVMDSAFTNSGFIVRGLSSEGFTPAGAPTGSLYVDGVLQTRYGARFGARNLWDTEQVEVYRGPQSTLSGRAAIAGAIYIKTKDPTPDHEAAASGIVGNRNFYSGAFMVNMPVIRDELSIRVAGAYQSQKTDVNYPLYERYNNLNDFQTEISGTIRAKALFTPSSMPDTRFLLTYSFSDDRPNERLIFENADFTLADRRGDGYSYAGFPLDTFAEYRAIKVHNVGLEVTHDLSDALRFTSQSGFTHGTTTRRSVDAGEPGVPDGTRGTVKDYLALQELRLNYDSGRWKGVVGVFGTHQKFDSALSLVSTPFFTSLNETFVRETSNLALFGEATYEVLPSWFITAGGRLDYLSEKTSESSDSIFVGTPQVASNVNEFDETNFVPRLGIAKALDRDNRIGFTYSQGFRTGGFYLDRLSLANVNYGPESARNYELFYKGKGLNGRLLINANLFYTRYNNQQIEIAPISTQPNYTIIVNAASSRSWGFEVEPTLRVGGGLSLFTSLGYLNTRFRDFNTAVYGDLSGEQFPDAPELSVAFGGRFEMPNGFFIGGDAKYTSRYTARFGEGRPDRLGARTIVNLQAGVRVNALELTAFAENLFDLKYLTFADRDASAVYGQAGARRTIGLNAKLRF